MFCRETQEKFDIKIQNGTITYKERKTYTFVPEKSSGLENDTLYTTNIPVLVSANFICLNFWLDVYYFSCDFFDCCQLNIMFQPLYLPAFLWCPLFIWA